MGIENIDILKANEPTGLDNKRRSMSQHVITNEKGKFVFGWDQPLQSFFLQVHVEGLSEEENPVVWLGATARTRMYEVEDLSRAAAREGLIIDHDTRVKLYGEKDDGN